MLRRLVRSLANRNRPADGRTRRHAPTVEQLEKRELLATSPILGGGKIKVYNSFNGNLLLNTNRIIIPFSGNVNILDASKIQVRGYAINPQSASGTAQIKKVINVVSATVISADHRFVEVVTDRLVRKGGKIFLYAGGFKDDNGDDLAEQTLILPKGQNKERFTLACRVFTPTNLNRLGNDLYANAPTPATANNVVDETTATTNLGIFLDKKVALGQITQAQRDAAMTRFSSTAAKGTIPDHNLRAALFALTGTFAEGAIASWLDGANVTGKPYTIIAFQDPGDATVPVAKTSARPSDGRLRTVFRPEFSGEPFQVLSAYVAHEALHQDNTFTLQEEVAATTFGVLITCAQSQVDSNYLKAGTKLVAMENANLLAFINSGKTIFPYVGVLESPNKNAADGGVFRGSITPSDGMGVFKSFDDYIRRGYLARGSPIGNSTGNALLNQYYAAVTTKTPSANMQFSDTIINDIDTFQSVLGTSAAIRLANIFRCKLS